MKKIQKFFEEFSMIHTMYILAGIIFVCAVCLLTWFLVGLNKTHPNKYMDIYEQTIADQLKNECTYARILDGICVDTDEDVSPPLVAVMIENHFDARPQAGLSQASIVYEAPVEGNISRFMALYAMTSSTMDSISKVGPVRSARSYYLDWIHEYDNAMYMHVGGSPEALDRIKQEDINDFNQFWHGDHFWRSADRFAPHNVYTNAELWTDAWHTFYADTATTDSRAHWMFATHDACVDNCVTSIYVQFSGDTYAAEWRYSSSTETYMRYQLGSPHVDDDGTVITADTIVVQEVETAVVDGYGRLTMDTIGKGNAFVFFKGHKIAGTWKKNSVSGATIFYDEQGEEVSLEPGKIWVEVLNQQSLLNI